MRQLESERRSGEGVGCGIFFLLFGLPFVGAGLYSLLFSGLWQAGIWSTAFGGVFAILFGGMMVWGGISQINKASRFGKPNAEMSVDVVRHGESFTFLYQQPIRRATNIRFIGVFLVFRERHSYDNGDGTTVNNIDRLVQKFVRPGRYYSPGETLREEHGFRIPMRAMGIRNSYEGRKNAKVETMWVVKIRLHLGYGYDVWQDYKIDLLDGSVYGSPIDDTESAENRFDVWLVECSLKSTMRMSKILQDVLPHMEPGQVGDSPCVLLERVTSLEAQEVKDKLEATGAVIAIKPADSA